MIKNPKIRVTLQNIAREYPECVEALQTLGRLIKSEYELKIRSSGQNRYYWGVVVATMQDCTGYSAKECHDLLKKILLPPRVVDVGGQRVEILANTHDMSTRDFDEQLTEPARQWIVEQFGVYVPLPNEPPE